MFARGASKLAFCGTRYRNWYFILESTIHIPSKAKAKVEVEAYTACSPTAPASWLSAANNTAIDISFLRVLFIFPIDQFAKNSSLFPPSVHDALASTLTSTST
jgi:hypothetical protein